MFISHDRAFLDRIATRIVEVDRGALHNWPGRYADYRRRKAEALAAESAANKDFDKKLAQEEAWLRQGVKARGTRNMGRVRALDDLREQAANRRKYQQRAQIRAQFGEQSSKRVLEALQVNARIADTTVLRDFSFKLQRGQVLGIIGPNGCGKTTLLHVLLGQRAPDSGTPDPRREPAGRLLRPEPRTARPGTRRRLERGRGRRAHRFRRPAHCTCWAI